ncbi:MAG TPA: cellulase family glycosylhydrolase [Pyrinomonadaceae bacterium]|jgi:hypothetical protein
MLPRLTRLIALLAVLVAAFGASPAPAGAAKKMEVALGDDATFLSGLRSPFKGLSRAKSLHVTWIRVSMPWSTVLKKQANYRKKPKKLTYHWRQWDDIVARARRKGIAVQLTLSGPAPKWASGNKKKSNYKPKAKYYGRFANAAAKHFGRNVWRYEIWNEPNLRVWLSPLKRSAKIYRSLYAAAYRNIKSVSKKNQVLIGETAPFARKGRNIAPLKFLRGVTCVNSRYKHRRCKNPLRADGYAHHPYDYTHKPTYRYPGKDNVTLGTLSRLTKALSRLRKSRALLTPKSGVLPVYLTEYGYFSAGNTKRSRKYNISKKRHAKYLVQAFKIARKNKHVKQLLQYLLVTPPKKYGFFATQIMSAKFKPYAPYTALRKWTASEAKRGGIATKPKLP